MELRVDSFIPLMERGYLVIRAPNYGEWVRDEHGNYVRSMTHGINKAQQIYVRRTELVNVPDPPVFPWVKDAVDKLGDKFREATQEEIAMEISSCASKVSPEEFCRCVIGCGVPLPESIIAKARQLLEWWRTQ